MNIFGFKSRRTSARLAPVRPLGWVGDIYARPERVNRNITEQIRAAYAHNPVAQRCCRLVAEAVAGAPLLIDDASVAVLLCERAGGQVLLESVATQLMLHGNAYVQLLPGAGELPAELYALAALTPPLRIVLGQILQGV